MSKDAVKSVPLCTSSRDGALIAAIFITIVEAASLLNTAKATVSIPAKFPWLSSIGTLKIILNDAIGEIPTFVLFVGVMYGSLGATITELAVMVGGGKLYVFHTFGLARAAASEARSVVIGAGIYPHILPGF
jgi:hypothetical protein